MNRNRGKSVKPFPRQLRKLRLDLDGMDLAEAVLHEPCGVAEECSCFDQYASARSSRLFENHCASDEEGRRCRPTFISPFPGFQVNMP